MTERCLAPPQSQAQGLTPPRPIPARPCLAPPRPQAQGLTPAIRRSDGEEGAQGLTPAIRGAGTEAQGLTPARRGRRD